MIIATLRATRREVKANSVPITRANSLYLRAARSLCASGSWFGRQLSVEPRHHKTPHRGRLWASGQDSRVAGR